MKFVLSSCLIRVVLSRMDLQFRRCSFMIIWVLAHAVLAHVDWVQSNDADPRSWNISNEKRWGWWSPNDRNWALAVKEVWDHNQVRPPQLQGIPHTVHQIWLGGPLPERFKAWSSTWKSKNPSWSHRLWGDADVPNLNMRRKEAFDTATNLGEKSDIMRLEILEQFGGLYVDTDFECLRALEPIHTRHDFYAALSNVGLFEVSNGIIAAVPGHPIITAALDNVASPIALEEGAKAAHGAWPGMPIITRTGPGAFTLAVMQHVLAAKQDGKHTRAVIYPVGVFFPTPNNLPTPPSRLLIRDRFLRPETFAIHHWAASWVPY